MTLGARKESRFGPRQATLFLGCLLLAVGCEQPAPEGPGEFVLERDWRIGDMAEAFAVDPGGNHVTLALSSDDEPEALVVTRISMSGDTMFRRRVRVDPIPVTDALLDGLARSASQEYLGGAIQGTDLSPGPPMSQMG